MSRDLTALINETLAGRYTVEREVGRGGNARIYRARDRSGRLVALKALHPELLTSVAADRFLREIKVLSQLDHPRIAGVLDSGTADWLVYYVMPFVEGPSLREVIDRERPLALDRAQRIGDDLLDALDHAHRRGFVHRDVKPDNVIVTPAAGAVLLDFGIARAVAVAGGDRLTASGIAVGTSTYMSPEQITAAQELDQRSDLYSLGCMWFEMLAGQPPFTGANDVMVMQLHLRAPPPDIRTLRPDAPPAVAEALSRALAKQPGDRWPDARSMRAALGNGAA